MQTRAISRKTIAIVMFSTLFLGGLGVYAHGQGGWARVNLTTEQRAALQEAQKSNDPTKVQALLKEYGIPDFKGGKGPALSAEQKAALDTAITNRDYAAWAKLQPAESKILKVITADNFARYAEMIEAKQKGDTATVQTIAKELGLPFWSGKDLKHGFFSPEVQKALDAKDYTAFHAALPANSPLATKITADNFARFLDMIAAEKSGDKTTAQSIAKELGIEVNFRPERMKNAAVKAAIEAKDFTAFHAALPANSPLATNITADNFAQFLDMIAAQKSGDTTKADQLRTALGIPAALKGHGHPFGGMKKMGQDQ